MSYLANLEQTLITMNRRALHYRDGKAWDNKKRNTRKRQCPRGKAFRHLEAMEMAAEWHKLQSELESLGMKL